MHADAFDRFHEAESRLHRLDPRVKVVVAVSVHPVQCAAAGWGLVGLRSVLARPAVG